MPVFGAPRAKMFCDAAYSILLQGYDNFELVVQDGNVEKPLVEDPFVRRVTELLEGHFSYCCRADRGIFDALNKALQRSTGQILYFMCSDDLLCPGALVSVSEAFRRERFGGPYWVYGQTVSADATGRTQGIDGAPITYEQLLEHNMIGQPAVFWNRQMMLLAGMFDTRFKYAADYDLWLRFWRRREPEFLNQTLGIFRHHGSNASQTHAAAVEKEAKMISWRQRSMGQMLEKVRELASMKSLYPNGIPETVN